MWTTGTNTPTLETTVKSKCDDCKRVIYMHPYTASSVDYHRMGHYCEDCANENFIGDDPFYP